MIGNDEIQERGTTARATYERDSTPERGLQSLLEVYSSL